jgi:hypothetical protein
MLKALARKLSVATALVRLVQIVTEARVIDVLIHFGGHFQVNEAGRIVAMTASAAIVGCTERASEVKSSVAPTSQLSPPSTLPSVVNTKGRGRK